jgi:peptidoglycan/LPS O-acetylase OafA/YrhL
VEEQFYLVWPLAIFFIRKTKWQIVFMMTILALVIAARAIIWFYHIPELNYAAFYNFTRVDGICIGSLIALFQNINPFFIRKNLTLIIVVLAGVNFLFYFLNEPYGIIPYLALCGYTTFAVMFGLLINEMITGNSKFLKSIFRVRPLIYLGKISYGLYVFHWPIFAMLSPVISGYVRKYYGLSGPANLTITGIAVTIMGLLLSILSYNYFEIKFLRLKDKFR